MAVGKYLFLRILLCINVIYPPEASCKDNSECLPHSVWDESRGRMYCPTRKYNDSQLAIDSDHGNLASFLSLTFLSASVNEWGVAYSGFKVGMMQKKQNTNSHSPSRCTGRPVTHPVSIFLVS